MKKVIVTMACCALVAPLAFAKDSKKKLHLGVVSAERAVTVTAPRTVTQVEMGEVAAYQPSGAVVVRQDGPGRYVLDEPGHIFNRRGESISSALRPGTRVQVFFAGDRTSRTVDHVVVY